MCLLFIAARLRYVSCLKFCWYVPVCSIFHLRHPQTHTLGHAHWSAHNRHCSALYKFYMRVKLVCEMPLCLMCVPEQGGCVNSVNPKKNGMFILFWNHLAFLNFPFSQIFRYHVYKSKQLEEMILCLKNGTVMVIEIKLSRISQIFCVFRYHQYQSEEHL